MRSLFATLLLPLSLLVGGSASAATMTSQVGVVPTDASCTPSPCDNQTPVGIGDTLTGGFISTDFTWTHSYSAIVGTINSATLELDIIDDDGGLLRVRQDTVAGELVGDIDPTGSNSGGGPGPWRVPGDPLDPSPIINIASTFFSDLADGSFTFFGDNVGLGIWGTNRAILTVDYTPSGVVVPLPAALPLFGTGLALLGISGWWRRGAPSA